MKQWKVLRFIASDWSRRWWSIIIISIWSSEITVISYIPGVWVISPLCRPVHIFTSFSHSVRVFPSFCHSVRIIASLRSRIRVISSLRPRIKIIASLWPWVKIIPSHWFREGSKFLLLQANNKSCNYLHRKPLRQKTNQNIL